MRRSRVRVTSLAPKKTSPKDWSFLEPKRERDSNRFHAIRHLNDIFYRLCNWNVSRKIDLVSFLHLKEKKRPRHRSGCVPFVDELNENSNEIVHHEYKNDSLFCIFVYCCCRFSFTKIRISVRIITIFLEILLKTIGKRNKNLEYHDFFKSDILPIVWHLPIYRRPIFSAGL